MNFFIKYNPFQKTASCCIEIGINRLSVNCHSGLDPESITFVSAY